jgi:hypothetical protein
MVSGRADTQLAIQFNSDRQYWKEVLKRIIVVIKFLSSRELPLRGDNQPIGSVRNKNYLGIMELLSQFDPFLCEHIKKYGNAGKGILSYLSVKICEEFIELMGSKVLAAVVTEIQKAKYFFNFCGFYTRCNTYRSVNIYLTICKECCSKRAFFAVYFHS